MTGLLSDGDRLFSSLEKNKLDDSLNFLISKGTSRSLFELKCRIWKNMLSQKKYAESSESDYQGIWLTSVEDLETMYVA